MADHWNGTKGRFKGRSLEKEDYKEEDTRKKKTLVLESGLQWRKKREKDLRRPEKNKVPKKRVTREGGSPQTLKTQPTL